MCFFLSVTLLWGITQKVLKLWPTQLSLSPQFISGPVLFHLLGKDWVIYCVSTYTEQRWFKRPHGAQIFDAHPSAETRWYRSNCLRYSFPLCSLVWFSSLFLQSSVLIYKFLWLVFCPYKTIMKHLLGLNCSSSWGCDYLWKRGRLTMLCSLQPNTLRLSLES